MNKGGAGDRTELEKLGILKDHTNGRFVSPLVNAEVFKRKKNTSQA